MNEAELIWQMLYGALGLGFFVYGRRQNAIMPYVTGLGLMGLPYFVSGTLPLVVIGALLTAAGFLIRL